MPAPAQVPASTPWNPTRLDGAARQLLCHAALGEQHLPPCQLLRLADVESGDGVCVGWASGRGRGGIRAGACQAACMRLGRRPAVDMAQARHALRALPPIRAPVMSDAARHTSRSASGSESEGSWPRCSWLATACTLSVGRPAQGVGVQAAPPS